MKLCVQKKFIILFAITSLLLCHQIYAASQGSEQASAATSSNTNKYQNSSSSPTNDHLMQEGLVQVQLVPKTEAVLSSQIAGKIDKISLQEGDNFKKGDVLIYFDCTLHSANLAKARALHGAKQTRHDSNQRLNKLNAISHVELAEGKAELADAAANVRIRSHQVNHCNILAPYDGKVVKINVNPHETVKQGEPLIEILSSAKLQIEIIAPSNWLAWLQSDQKFQVYIAETRKWYPAHLTKIVPRVDSVSQSIKLIGEIDQQNSELIAGMSGKAKFPPQKNQ